MGTDWDSEIFRAVRFDDQGLESFQVPHFGVPGSPRPHNPWPSIAVAPAGVFVSAGGLAQLTDDGFIVVDHGPPGSLWQIQDIAVDETGGAWIVAAGEFRPGPTLVGHARNGDYREVSDQAEAVSRGLDGHIWIATPSGPKRLDGDDFKLGGPPLMLGEAWADPLPTLAGRRRTLSPYAVGPDGVPYVALSESDRGEVIVRLEGGAWQEQSLLPADDAITALAASPDGALWAAAGIAPARLWRLADGAWQSVSMPPRGVDGIRSIVFGDDGQAWLYVLLDRQCEMHPDIENELVEVCTSTRAAARLARDVWEVFQWPDAHQLGVILDGAYVGSPAIAPDGSIWVATGEAVLRLDNGQWTEVVSDVGGLRHVAVGPEGSVWAGGVGLHRLDPALIARAADFAD